MFNKYKNLNTVYLNKTNLLHNLEYLKSLNSKAEIFPNLKSNAYGHGIKEIFSIIKNLDFEFVVVDSIYEAFEIYKSKSFLGNVFKFKMGNSKWKILISGYVDPENKFNPEYPFSYAVWDTEQVKKLLRKNPQIKLHLFVDTGMNREGVRIDELENFAEEIAEYKDNFEGIMSHFSSSDDLENNKTILQIEQFVQAISILERRGFHFEYKHISASGGIITKPDLEFNAARTGIATYGISPISDVQKNLKPVLSLTTRIVQIKTVKKGETIGYNDTFTATEDMKIAILPIGYNDGVDRRLSSVGSVKYKNDFCKYVGRVSMNISTIDITNIKNPKIGDEVIIFSDNVEDENSISKLASQIGTIPYELLVHIHPSTRRVTRS